MHLVHSVVVSSSSAIPRSGRGQKKQNNVAPLTATWIHQLSYVSGWIRANERRSPFTRIRGLFDRLFQSRVDIRNSNIASGPLTLRPDARWRTRDGKA